MSRDSFIDSCIVSSKSVTEMNDIGSISCKCLIDLNDAYKNHNLCDISGICVDMDCRKCRNVTSVRDKTHCDTDSVSSKCLIDSNDAYEYPDNLCDISGICVNMDCSKCRYGTSVIDKTHCDIDSVSSKCLIDSNDAYECPDSLCDISGICVNMDCGKCRNGTSVIDKTHCDTGSVSRKCLIDSNDTYKNLDNQCDTTGICVNMDCSKCRNDTSVITEMHCDNVEMSIVMESVDNDTGRYVLNSVNGSSDCETDNIYTNNHHCRKFNYFNKCDKIVNVDENDAFVSTVMSTRHGEMCDTTTRNVIRVDKDCVSVETCLNINKGHRIEQHYMDEGQKIGEYPSNCNIGKVDEICTKGDKTCETKCVNTSETEKSVCSERNRCKGNDAMLVKGKHVLQNTFGPLKEYKNRFPKNLIVSYLNINSILGKFSEISEIMKDELADIVSFAETKIDETVLDAVLNVRNYKSYRNDGTRYSHGLITYIRSDITHCRRKDQENSNCGAQYIILEVWLRKKKWFYMFVYKPPSVKNEGFVAEMLKICEMLYKESSDILIAGDMNIDMKDVSSSNKLNDLCEIVGLQNIIKETTCFKSANESLIDVILVSNSNRYNETLVFDTGLSDFHKMITVSTKVHAPKRIPRKIVYRSLKKLNEENFKSDIQCSPHF